VEKFENFSKIRHHRAQNQNTKQKTSHKTTLNAKKSQRVNQPSQEQEANETNQGAMTQLINMFSTINNTNSPNSQSSNDEFSQPTHLTPKTAFQAEFGTELNANDHLEIGNHFQKPPSTKENRENKISCSELSRYIWSQAEKQNFKTVGALNIWVRNNLKVEIVHRSSVSSVMKTAGSKKCGLCMAERTSIYYDMYHVEKSKKLMNKKTEICGKCTYTTHFHWLSVKKDKMGADESTKWTK